MTDSMKLCTKCQRSFPVTSEYFNRDKQKPDGFRPDCRECRSQQQHQYYEANRDQLLEKHRQWYWENRDRVIEHRRQYNKKHYDRVLKQKREYARINRDQKRRYNLKNKHKKRQYRATRRAKKMDTYGKYTIIDIQRLIDLQDKKCLYCECALGEYHVDHFIPILKAGRNSPDNLVIACPTCNRSKGNKMPWEWYRWNKTFPVEWNGKIL
jgi:5-methylcytosine-specific restriction endonuclease McrA